MNCTSEGEKGVDRVSVNPPPLPPQVVDMGSPRYNAHGEGLSPQWTRARREEATASSGWEVEFIGDNFKHFRFMWLPILWTIEMDTFLALKHVAAILFR